MTPAAVTTEAKRDAVLVAAVDAARAAAVSETGEALVGEHLGVVMEEERLATHSFACLNPAYVGLPWSERVLPGDLGPGDVLPTAPDDVRLVAGLTAEDDLESAASQSPLHPGQWELGLGRVRVLSPVGRDDAADRWVEGDFGPTTPMARQASHECGSCGFMLPIGGPLGQLFAVCAHLPSPADGRVVALTFGCGAHSEVEVEVEAKAEEVFDEGSWDPLELGHS